MIPLSIIFSIAHAMEETFFGDGSPLWESFGEIADVRIPDWLGFPLFFLGLTGALTIVAVLGYGGDPFWLGVLVGARLGDCWFSHWWRTIRGNVVPGNWTTPLYVFESVTVMATMAPSAPGMLVGAASFAAVIPSLRLAGFFGILKR